MFENLSTLIVEIDEATDIANIKLNRPEKANALTGNMIHEVTKVFNALRKDERINRVILTGEGKHFCAGADVAEMTTNAEAMSSEKLADMFEEVRLFSEQKRLVVGVHGACMGGGCGFLVPNAIVIASDKPEDKTRFRFPEAMIGVRPSTISPHVISRIGAENAKYYFAGCDVIGIDR